MTDYNFENNKELNFISEKTKDYD